MKRFRIGVRFYGEYLYYEVRLHETLAEMHTAYRRSGFYRPEWDGASGPEDDWLGRVCPVRLLPERGSHPRIGFILLNRVHAGTRVVSHEVVHAALGLYRSLGGHLNDPANFGKRCSDKEEDLAYIYAELFVKMTRKLHALGVWG